jgi:hypothetical protein
VQPAPSRARFVQAYLCRENVRVTLPAKIFLVHAFSSHDYEGGDYVIYASFDKEDAERFAVKKKADSDTYKAAQTTWEKNFNIGRIYPPHPYDRKDKAVQTAWHAEHKIWRDKQFALVGPPPKVEPYDTFHVSEMPIGVDISDA